MIPESGVSQKFGATPMNKLFISRPSGMDIISLSRYLLYYIKYYCSGVLNYKISKGQRVGYGPCAWRTQSSSVSKASLSCMKSAIWRNTSKKPLIFLPLDMDIIDHTVRNYKILKGQRVWQDWWAWRQTNFECRQSFFSVHKNRPLARYGRKIVHFATICYWDVFIRISQVTKYSKMKEIRRDLFLMHLVRDPFFVKKSRTSS